jgi:diguanylate cyclase (GGDEF)-like protein
MSELAKRLERAEKAIAKHKPDLALVEYMDVLRDDPQNDKVRESAADLCVTMNRPAEAAALLAPLFERFASIGDNPHAVITFKKIVRLTSPTVEQWSRFGQLSEKLNRRDALEAYEAAFSGLMKVGRKAEARGVLERIVALDSSEQNHRRLGDLALDLADKKAAAAAFFQAGTLGQKAGRDPSAWFQQAYAADPGNLPIAIAYARTVLERADAARAVTILEPFASMAGGNQELGEIYGRSLLAAGKPKPAEPFIWALYQRDPKQLGQVVQLLRAFVKDHENASALTLAKQLEISEHKLGHRREFAKTLKEIADENPLEVEFLEYLVQVLNNASREHDYCKTLLKLFDLYYASGNFFKAGDALDRAAEVDPYEPGHEQRLERLRGKIDSHLFNAIANRFHTAASSREPESHLAHEDAQTNVLQDLILQAEIFLQYSMRSKALERLERITEVFPYEEDKNQKLQQLFLAAGYTPKYKGQPRPVPVPAREAAPLQSAAPSSTYAEAAGDIARINELTRNIYRQGNVNSVLFTAVNEVGRHWQVSRCVAALCAPGKPLSAALEYCAPGLRQSDVTAIVKLISALLPVVEKRGAVSLADVTSAPESAEVREAVATMAIRSVLAVSLMDGDRLAGILLLEQCDAQRQWREADIVVIKTITDQMVQAIQNVRLRSLVRNLAVTDERSGLLKRSSYLDLLLSEMRRTQQRKSTVTVMLFYFGKPSALVKEGGEAALKELMLQIGQVMSANVRQSDMAVRYDLTTVALILSDTKAKNAAFVAEKMRKALSGVKEPSTSQELVIAVGIAEAAMHESFDPVDIVTELINRAEAALEIAKADSINRVQTLAANTQSVAVA